MRLQAIEAAPFHGIAYEVVTSGHGVAPATLPITKAIVDTLPPSLAAILATSDLQGREPGAANGRRRLLGEMVAEEMAILGELGVVPPATSTGVLLAGDLFSRPLLDRRGGSGDVRPVWEAFGSRFRWVAGVAGNHDIFGEKPSVPDFKAFIEDERFHFLDGTLLEVEGLRLAGISGILGNPRKPFRREESAYLELLDKLLVLKPDLLLLHNGPDVPAEGLRGQGCIRETLEAADPLLVICGHAHWDTPLAELSNGTQVLNVDARCVLIQHIT